MKLQIRGCRPLELSQKASELQRLFSEVSDDQALADHLSETYVDDFYEVEDLNCWTSILERIDDILTRVGAEISTCDCLIGVQTRDEAKGIICNLLRFLCLLLKASKDKRYFLSIQSIRRLMRAVDLEVAALAMEVVFNVCIPSSSISSNLNDDWIDSVEIADDLTHDALIVFDALSLLSTDFGLTEYLRGHQPPFMSIHHGHGHSAATVSLQFPPRKDGDGSVTVSLDASNWFLEVVDSTAMTSRQLLDLQGRYQLTADELWTVYNVLCTCHGFQSSLDYRLGVVRLRMQSFFLLVHSKVSPQLIQEHMRHGSPFLQDLVDLADISSEATGELNLPCPITTAYVALESVLGLLENKLRRRSSFIIQSNILHLLGLFRASDDNNAQASVSSRAHGDAWSSIVHSACSAAPALFAMQRTGTGTSQAPSDEAAAASHDRVISSTGKFIRIGLELFVLSLTTREPSNVINDMPTVSAIVGLIQGALPHVSSIIKSHNACVTVAAAHNMPSAYDVHVLLVVSKAIYCLELTVERTEYMSAFRECDGMKTITSIIEIFAADSLVLQSNQDPSQSRSESDVPVAVLHSPTRNLLEATLNVLVVTLQKSRMHHHAAIIMQPNAGETGIRIASQGYFGSFCAAIFRSPYHKNELIWSELVTVLKEIIDTDPSYLNTFLSSPHALVFLNAFNPDAATGSQRMNHPPYQIPSLFISKSATDLEVLLLPLARFALILCITAQGKDFVRRSRLVHFILEATVHPNNLLPQSLGIYSDKLIKIGKILAQITVDFEEMRVELKELLKKKLIVCCSDAKTISQRFEPKEEPHLSSPRVQILQKLANACIVVESMCSENRASTNELVREVMSDAVVEGLVSAYSCTLPPSRQLFAQLSLRHTLVFPHYGQSSCARAITSLLKLTPSRVSGLSSTLLSTLFRESDEKLSLISSSKQSLRALCPAPPPNDSNAKAKDDGKGTDEELYEAQSSSLSSKNKRRSRGSSLGGTSSSANVLVLGILDYFPHRCVIDPLFEQELSEHGNAYEVERLTWQFLSSVLVLEWLCIMTASVLRNPHSKPTAQSCKDIFRRLFGFHRSCMLEICRFAAQKSSVQSSTEKEVAQSDGPLDFNSFCQCTSAEDESFRPRVPTVYHLQIAGSGGALVREGIDLDGNRVTFIAEVGSRVDAFERRRNSAGITRYRTAHGWISEIRKDQRSPIVELIGLQTLSADEVLKQQQQQLVMGSSHSKQSDAKRDDGDTAAKKSNSSSSGRKVDLSELLTFREAASFCLTRAHGSLRQVIVYLSRGLQSSESSGLRAGAMASTASGLSTSLSGIMKAFMAHPLPCLDDSSLVSTMVKELRGAPVMPHQLPGGYKIRLDGEKSSKLHLWGAAAAGDDEIEDRCLVSFNSQSFEIHPEDAKDSSSSSTSSSSSSSSSIIESTSIDISTLCLYYGTVMKHVLHSVIEDKNGCFNILLLRGCINQGLLPYLCDALSMIILTVQESVQQIVSSKKGSSAAPWMTLLNSSGRCSLHSLTGAMKLFRRLINRDMMTKALSTLSSTLAEHVESGKFSAHELVFQLLSAMYTCVLPLITNNILVQFPAEVQMEWLTLVGELLGYLSAPLPPPKESAHRSTSENSSNNSNSSSSARATIPFGGSSDHHPQQQQSPPALHQRRMNIAHFLDSPRGGLLEGGGLGLGLQLGGPSMSMSMAGLQSTVQQRPQSSPPSSQSQSQSAASQGGSQAGFFPESLIVEMLMEMGFERGLILTTMFLLQTNNLDRLTEYLLTSTAATPTTWSSSPMTLQPLPSTSDPLPMLNESLPIPPEALLESQSPHPRLVHVSSEEGGLVRDDTGHATAAIDTPPPLPPASSSGGNRTSTAADAPAISEFDALPDLVNDLDLSDDSGQQRLVEQRSNGEPMEASSPPALDPSALLASSSSVSVDARSSGSTVHGSSSITSRMNGFLIDPTPSVRPSSVVPIPRFLHPDSSAKPIDSGHHHHHSSRKSNNSSYSSYNQHSQMLLQHADRIWKGLVPNIMEICSQFDFICRWDAKQHPQQHSFMPFLVDLLSKFNGLSMTASGVGRYATVYLHVSSRLRDEASQYLSVVDEKGSSSSSTSPQSPRLAGYLTFLIHFLHDQQILKQLLSDDVFTRAESAHLTTVVVGLVRKLLGQAELLQQWPSWLSPAFVLMNLIAKMHDLSDGSVKAALKREQTSSSQSTDGGSGGVAQKQSSAASDDPPDGGSGGAPGRTTERAPVLDGTLLLPRRLQLDVLEVAMDLICSACTSCSTVRVLSSESYLSVLICLPSLLSDHVSIARFVQRGLLVRMLQLSAAVAGTEEEKASELQLFSQILQRCMETEVELQQQVILKVQDVFKALTTTTDKSVSLPLDSFLKSLNPLIVRSVSDFILACKQCVRFVKVPAKETKKPLSSDEESDSPLTKKLPVDCQDEASAAATSKYEVHVKQALDHSSSSSTFSFGAFSLDASLLSSSSSSSSSSSFEKEVGPDARCYSSLESMLLYVVTAVKASKTAKLCVDAASSSSLPSDYSHISGVLEAMSDAILSLKRSHFLAARIIKAAAETDSLGLGLSSNENFLDFLISSFLGERTNDPQLQQLPGGGGQRRSILSATSRFLVSLCAFQGSSRTIALNSILKALRSASVTSFADVTVMDSHVLRLEEDRALLLSRLTALLSVIIRASKTSQWDDPLPVHPESARGQGVCVETIHYLLDCGGLLKLLIQSLSSLRVSMKLSTHAVNSILEIIELITRPKLQAHLDRLSKEALELPTARKPTTTGAASTASQQQPSFASSSNSGAMDITHNSSVQLFPQSRPDDFIDMTMEDNMRRLDYIDHQQQHHQSQPTASAAAASMAASQGNNSSAGFPNGNNSNMNNELSGGDVDEDEDDDDDDDDEDDDDDDEDDDDDDDDDDDLANYASNTGESLFDQLSLIGREMSSDGAGGDDSYINVDHVMSASDTRSHHRTNAEALLQSYEQARMAMEHGLEVRDLNLLPNNSFITPPDRLMTTDFTHFFMSGGGVEGDQLMADMMARRMRSDAAMADHLMVPGEGGDNLSNGTGIFELLPQGISAALDVSHPPVLHPILLRQISNSRFIGSVSAADNNALPSMQPSNVFRTQAFANGIPTFANGIRRPVIATPSGTRTVIHFSSSGGAWADSRLPANDAPAYGGGLLELPVFDEIDPTGPAAWPQRHTQSVVIDRNELWQTNMVGNSTHHTHAREVMQYYLESSLIPGLDLEEEEDDDEGLQEDFSQVSFTDGADGGFSFSTLQSNNEALQDPNPRGSFGEEDSRNGHQDPIPPLIEITHPFLDQEGNEDISVITLPPEDATAPHTDDDLSLNAQQLSAIAEEASFVYYDQQHHGHHHLYSEAVAAASAGEVSSSGHVEIASFSEFVEDTTALYEQQQDFNDSPAANDPTASPLLSPDADVADDDAAVSSTANGPLQQQHPTEAEGHSTQLSDGGDGDEAVDNSPLIRCPDGYDESIFYSLPMEMQMEIVEQYGETNDQMRALIESSGLDYNTIISLPEDIRQEVLEQARREQQQSSASAMMMEVGEDSSGAGDSSRARAQDMDSASFLASLTLELRTEVLLTAESDFLATLPPELVAEAQMLRDRAASTWQRRELMSRMGSRDGAAQGGGVGGGMMGRAVNESTAAIAAGIGAPDEFRDVGGDEEDEFEMDVEGDELQLQPRHRIAQSRGLWNFGSSPGSGRSSDNSQPKLGLMRIPLSEKWTRKLPNNLVLSIAKVVLNAPEQPSKCSPLICRILQNISNDLKAKDLSLRLLIGLVAGRRQLLLDTMQEYSAGHSSSSSNSVGQLIERRCDCYDGTSKPLKPVRLQVSGGDYPLTVQDVEVTAAAAKRIISIVTNCVESNASFVYLLLLERDDAYAVKEDALLELQQQQDNDNHHHHHLVDQHMSSTAQEVEPSASSSPQFVLKQSSDADADPQLKENNARLNARTRGRGDREINTSSNSLLELIISLFVQLNVSGNAFDLASLSSLLALVTAPLDSISDQTDDTISGSGSIITPEMKARDGKQNLVSVAVPRVSLSKASLQTLCDVLLGDCCLKSSVLTNITNAISRLSKISSNHRQLIELMSELIIELADESNGKLRSLTDILTSIKANHDVSESTGHRSAVSSVVSLKPSSRPETASSRVILPTNLLPLGEAGGRQHDRLLRIVQTLQSMAMKTSRSLQDVTPSEQLLPLWSGLDAALSQLKGYLVEDDESSSSGDNAADSIRPQSTLTSILNRLLPAIESFFLIHTSDLLMDKPKLATDVPTHAATATVGGGSSKAVSDDPSPSLPDPIPLSSMPGHSYRTSRSYLNTNLSLFADSDSVAEEAISMQQLLPVALRKQLSLQSSHQLHRTGSVLKSRAQRLLHFVQSHKGLLNLIIKARPHLLINGGSMSALVRVTQLKPYLKFENKRKYFFTQLKKKSEQHSGRRSLNLQIRRHQVFEDSFNQLRMRPAEEMRSRLQVNFYGEEGVDAGGLSREWYMILSREIFDPNYVLFTATADGATFQPNPLSMINTNHLDYFKFIGRVIGKAICDAQLMDAHFTRSFYKHVLGMPIDFHDIEATEPDYYKILQQILDSPIDLLMVDLTFSAEIQKFGRTEIVDLIPNGRNIPVTDDNKHDYISRIAHHRMTAAIKAQIDSFLQGFYDLVPPELISIFSPTELELLICGLPEVNIEELQMHTEYHQYKSTDEVIVWFWDTLKNFNREERAAFLQFVTGTSKVPLGGFANLQGMRGNQKFSIHKAYGDSGLLPTAHTCFNQLDLPSYSSAEDLKQKLLMAITEGMEGFGFA